MTKRFTVIAKLLFLTSLALGQANVQPSPSTSGEETRLRQLDIGVHVARITPPLSRAEMAKFIPSLEEILAAEYLRIDSKGRIINREEEVKRWKALPTSNVGKGTYAAEIDDVQLQFQEGVAIVKEVVDIRNTMRPELEPTGKYRVINLYKKQADNWFLVTSQWTAITTR